MTPTEEMYRGEEAERLLNHPLLKAALSDCKDGIVQAMQSSPMGDTATHNKLVIALQLLGQIEKSIKTHIETGKMAQLQIKDKSFLQAVGFK